MEPQQTDPNNQPAPQPEAQPPAQTASPAPTANVPATWPGAFGVFQYSKSAVKLNFWTLAVFWLISFGLGTLFQKKLGIAGDAISLILSSLASVGFVLAFLGGIRGQRVAIGEAFQKSLPYLAKMIGLTIVTAIIVFFSVILLIIPFFFVLPRLALANYFLVDKNMGILEAVKASWHATKGNAMKVWGIYGVTILFAVLCLVLVGIYLLIMYSAAIAVLYEFLNRNPAAHPVEAAAPAQQPAPAAEPQPVSEPQTPETPSTNPVPPTNPQPPTV